MNLESLSLVKKFSVPPIPSLKQKQNLWLDAEFSYQKHGIFPQAMWPPAYSYLYLFCQTPHCKPGNRKRYIQSCNLATVKKIGVL